MRRACHELRRAAGFTYVGLIVLVAIVGLVGAATLKVDALLRRAAAEEELLEIGAAFSLALKSYAEATPRGQPTYPPTLQALLKDPRSPALRRHLRKIFVDPVTGKPEWGIVHAGGDSGVLAVYSLSSAKPLKVANFDARFANLENREHISDWKFAALGQAVAQPGQNPAGVQTQTAAGTPPAQASLFPDKTAAPAVPAAAPSGSALPPAAPPSSPAPAPAETPAAAAPPAEASGAGEDKNEAESEEKSEDKGEEKSSADDARGRRDRQAPPAAADTR